MIEYDEDDLNLRDLIEIPFRFAKKATYDFDNLWFKFPFLFDRG